MGQQTYEAIGGVVTLPITSLSVRHGQCIKVAKTIIDTTGPGSGGATGVAGDFRYMATVRCVYKESVESSTEQTLDKAETGTATIHVGNGEVWSGACIVQRLDAVADWQGGTKVPVTVMVQFNGRPAITQPNGGD